MALTRIESGIDGLDRLIEGGYPKGSVILISGGPGTGKTTFAAQYIYNGAKQGESGVYVTFEQTPEQIMDSAERFGINFSKLAENGKVEILRIKNAQDITDVLKEIDKKVKKIRAKRLVVDSLSSIELFATTFKSMAGDFPVGVINKKLTIMPPPKAIIRRLMYRVVEHFKGLNLTTILTSESQGEGYSRYGVAEFVTDGLITLHYLGMGATNFRSLKIVKLRETKHEEDCLPFEINKKGIRVKEKERIKA